MLETLPSDFGHAGCTVRAGMAVWRAAVAGVMLWATPAPALVALADPDGEAELVSARAVVAAHDAGATLWLQLELRVVGDRLVLVLPLTEGALLDPGDPDWFAAVESASAPRVVPPAGARRPACADPATVESTVAELGADAVEPDAVELLSDLATLSRYLDIEALLAEPEQTNQLADHTGAFVALSYAVSGSAPLLVGLRLHDALPPEQVLERLSSLAWRRPLPLTLTTLASEPLVVLAERPIAAEEVPATWFFEQGKSDYMKRRDELLRGDPGRVWLTEVVGQTPLFEHYVIDERNEVPSLVSDFERRLEVRGHTCPEFARVMDREWREQNRAAVSCAQGSLVHHGEFRCSADNDENAWDFECDGVQDLALAFSGARLGEVTLVRQVGMLPSQARLEPAVSEVRQVRVSTQASSGGECDVAGSTGRGGAPQMSGSSTGGSASTGHMPSPQPVPTPEVVVGVRVEGCSSSGESGCSTSSNPGTGDETCSGSSSSDYESEETCSGDSSPSGEADDACTGDSSSGQDGSSSSCSGDSSSEASAGETCAGDASADVEGDTCSGGGGGGGECAFGRRGLPRPRPSVLSIVAAALLLPWRRRTSRHWRRARVPRQIP